ncbi:PKD-like family lipoprotein [uncultured Prevotella sp.]|uniref:PKD-like family lipoprotein n=1 Tax=uncultured Prevotella sp. TaxID=159272 RepID=UPI0025F9E46B|nr:PKD-like family lipoprotein [uncultured Prevotella sp.]
MKNIIYVAMSALLLTSCYEDKGNYDYRFDSMNQVDISNVSYQPEAYEGVSGKVIEVQLPLTEDKVQRVEAKLSQTLSDNYDNLDFTWYTAYTATKRDPMTGREVTETVRDTLRTNGYVDLNFPANTDRNYSVIMEVKDRTTDLDYYAKLNVKTRLLFKNSLFFLHQQGGETFLGNVEKIGTMFESRSNAYKTAKPTITDNPFADAVKLGYTSCPYPEVNGLMVFRSNGRGNTYNVFKALDTYDVPLVPAVSSSFVASRVITVGNIATGNIFKCLLSRDGQFYMGKWAPYYTVPGEDAEESLQSGDYRVTAATVTESYYVLWDAKNNRFIYQSNSDWFPFQLNEYAQNPPHSVYPVMDAKVDFSSLGTLSPVGKTAVYGFIASHNEFFPDAKPQFIFKDADNNFYLYELTPVDAGGKSRGGDAGASESAFTITGKKLPDFHPGSNLASITYNPWFSTNYIFYAKDGNVIRHNLSNGDEQVIYTAPAGYTVSVIKFRTEDAESNSTMGSNLGDLGLYLSIGMNKESNGAVAEIKLTPAADVDESFSLFCDKDSEGNAFGRILDLQFAHVYTYSKDSN